MSKTALFLLLLLGRFHAFAQSADTSAVDIIKQKKPGLLALPIVFYSPETRLGFGAATSLTFRFKGDGAANRPSQLQVGFAYTLNKQVLFYLPFQLFYRQAQYRLYGEMGYYRYVYDFYGIGPQPGQREVYSVDFPRLRTNFLYRVRSHFYAGLRYWMDDYQVTKVENDGLLNAGHIPGSDGGFLSGTGPLLVYDSRDHLFAPRKGWNIELVNFYNTPTLGSDFSYHKWIIDAAVFQPIGERQVLACNAYVELTFGDAPFNQLALLGGNKRMRGYYEGYLRDNHLLVFQAEYRLPLFWRIGGVIFGGIGGVAPAIGDLQLKRILPHAGTGLRVLLDKKEKISLRIDAAFGKKSQGFYLTVGEAF